jgi:hypothetical protein
VIASTLQGCPYNPHLERHPMNPPWTTQYWVEPPPPSPLPSESNCPRFLHTRLPFTTQQTPQVGPIEIHSEEHDEEHDERVLMLVVTDAVELSNSASIGAVAVAAAASAATTATPPPPHLLPPYSVLQVLPATLPVRCDDKHNDTVGVRERVPTNPLIREPPEPLTNNAGARSRPPPWPNQQLELAVCEARICLRPPPWPNQLIRYHKRSLADPVTHLRPSPWPDEHHYHCRTQGHLIPYILHLRPLPWPPPNQFHCAN